MHVRVYDTHVHTREGRYLHFDVVTEQGDDAAKSFAKAYLAEKGLQEGDIFQSRCQYCHSEPADQGVVKAIETIGYHIVTLLDYPGNRLDNVASMHM